MNFSCLLLHLNPYIMKSSRDPDEDPAGVILVAAVRTLFMRKESFSSYSGSFFGT